MRLCVLTSLAACLVAVSIGGCRSIEYGPADGEIATRYGYREQLISPGRYVLTMIAGANANPLDMQAMWDRRAGELCGSAFDKKIFRASGLNARP